MRILSFLAFPFFFMRVAAAHEGLHPHSATASAEMRKAASLLLASLDATQRKDAQVAFQSPERQNWHFIPMTRDGVRFGNLQAHQQHLAFGLLGSGLSQKGLMTATQIMTLEQILRNQGGDPELRNPEKYFIAIFGEPSSTKAWGWRFEGHHLSLNFTILGERVMGFPAFLGTNPAELKEGPLKGLRPLGEIEDSARALAQSLITAGHEPVFSKKAPKEILTGQASEAEPLADQGVSSAKLDEPHVQKYFALIERVASMQRPELTHEVLKEIRASSPSSSAQKQNLHFAWAGSLERNGAHYFRIQGPDFVIEYANTQNEANHAHLVWRDLKNDFGRDFLKKHYAEEHQ